MSHFIVIKSSFEIRDVPGIPTTVPERSLYRIAFIGSIPRELNTPPRESLIATTRAFFSENKRAAIDPAFPKPWIATVAPRSDIFFTLQASSTATKQPRAVASWRPSDPPMEIGLPVTTPSDVRPLVMEYVSMIQAMV